MLCYLRREAALSRHCYPVHPSWRRCSVFHSVRCHNPGASRLQAVPRVRSRSSSPQFVETLPRFYEGANERRKDSLSGSGQHGLKTQLSSASIQLETDIVAGKADPLAILKAGLKTGDLDLETVWVCLDTYRNLQLNDLTREARTVQIRADGVGALTLDWLLKDKDRLAHVLRRELFFLHSICYYLVAEGHQDIILGIVKLDSVPGPDIHLSWRGIVLRALVKSMLLVTLGHRADDTINVYVKVTAEVLAQRKGLAWAGAHGRDGYARTSLYPAGVELARSLMANLFPKTSQDKYREFLKAYSKIPKPGCSYEWSCAMLSLFIPNATDPDPALSVLAKWMDPSSTHDLRRELGNSPDLKKHLHFVLVRLEDTLGEH